MQYLATLLAALLLLSGCTNDPEPKEPKEPKTSAPPPTASVPTMPPQAKSDPPEGAAAFVSHFIDAFNYAARTGDTAEMNKLSSKCAPCKKYATDFEKGFENGERLSNDLWVIKRSEVVTNDESLNVVAKIEGVEEGKPVLYDIGFTLPGRPPYAVQDIFQAVHE